MVWNWSQSNVKGIVFFPAGHGPVSCPGSGSGGRTPFPVPPKARVFYPTFKWKQEQVFLWFNQMPACNRHRAEQNASWQETQLWPTWVYMKLYPTCDKAVPIHTSADKRNMNEEKECEESVCPGTTYLSTLQFIIFFFPFFLLLFNVT